MRSWMLAAICLAGMQYAPAQGSWVNADAGFGTLPPSIHVFKLEDSLDGAPVRAFYVSVKLKDRSLRFNTLDEAPARYTLPQFYQQLGQRPVLILNSSFFSFESGEVLSLLINDGKLLAQNVTSLQGIAADSHFYYYPTRSALGIRKNRKVDVAWVFSETGMNRVYAFEEAPVIARGGEARATIFDLGNVNWVTWDMHTAVGGGPTLVHDGKIWITAEQEQLYPGEENRKQARTAMGYTTDERLIMLVIEGPTTHSAGVTLEQEAWMIKNIGCQEALNLNGGATSGLLINGRETIQAAADEAPRPVPAVFLVNVGK